MISILKLALLVFFIQLGEAEIWLEPRNITMTGTEVAFTCGTNEPWVSMVWRLNDRSLLTISKEHGPLGNDSNILAMNHTTSTHSLWQIVIKKADFLFEPQKVICELLPWKDPRHAQSALLFTQEKGSVAIVGGNRVVQQKGEDIVLQCQSSGWFPKPTLAWTMDGAAMDSSNFNTSSVQDSSGFYTLNSDLRLQVVKRCTVECSVSLPSLLKPQTSRISVTIETPKKNNILGISVSVTVAVIAILTFILVLFCSNRKGSFSLLKSSKKFQNQPSIIPLNSKSTGVETEPKVNLGIHSGPEAASNLAVIGSQHHDGITEASNSSRNKASFMIHVLP